MSAGTRYQAKNSEFHLSPSDLRQLVAAAGNPRDLLILELFIYTGIRRAELQQIRVEDLDLGRRRLIVRHGKGGKERILYLTDGLVASLRIFCAGRTDGPLFKGRYGGRLSERAINYIVSRVAQAAGLQTPNPRYRNIGPHLLRHSFARNWKVAGGSLETLRRILGHASLKTTLDLYGTESQADAEQNYRALAGRLVEGGASSTPDDGAVRRDKRSGRRAPTPHLAISREQLARFCRKQHIRRLSLFGSNLSGTVRPDSDLGLLVEFEPGNEPGLLGLASMEAELGMLLDGKKVELRTLQDLSPHLRDQVLWSTEVHHS